MSNSGKASASADIKGTNAGVKDRIILTTERVLCYIVLILITFLCLFSFYVLIINTTRSHPDIQKGFSFLPGKSFIVNMKNVLANENIPVIKGMFNSLFVAACSAVLSVYFSAISRDTPFRFIASSIARAFDTFGVGLRNFIVVLFIEYCDNLFDTFFLFFEQGGPEGPPLLPRRS